MTPADWPRRGPVGGGAGTVSSERRRREAPGPITAGMALPVGGLLALAGGGTPLPLTGVVADIAMRDTVAGAIVAGLAVLVVALLAGLMLTRRSHLRRAAEDAARRAAIARAAAVQDHLAARPHEVGRHAGADLGPAPVSGETGGRAANRRRRNGTSGSPGPEPRPDGATSEDPLIAAMRAHAGSTRPPTRSRTIEREEPGRNTGPRRRVAPPSATRPSTVPPPGRQATWVTRLDTRADPLGPRPDRIDEDERAAG